ncbi:Putative ATP-dependent helicase YHR031C family [Arachis hypogaea]|nr:Putative ATP-dependent helicase YHR031C family [Arachis hypogaea]
MRPRFLQLYIYDTEHELQNRMLENTQLHETLVFKLQQLLHRYNPFLHVFRQLAQRSDVHECSLVIRERPANQPQYSLPTASQVAAIIVGDDVETMIRGRDIKVQTHAGSLRRIQEFVGYYDPLQYLLLFSFGTHGWDINTRSQSVGKVSCRTYNSYMLHVPIPISYAIRPDDHSTILQAGRLLQQYVVDNYVKIEIGKLRWVQTRQKKLRAELYQENVGRKRTILPLSFIGSRRDMTQRYEDGMAIVLNEGKSAKNPQKERKRGEGANQEGGERGRACRRVTAARRAAVVADEGGVRRVCHGAGEARVSEERRHRRRAVHRQLRCTLSSPSPSDHRGVVAVEPALRAAIEPQAESDAKRERKTEQREEREKALRGFLSPLLSLLSLPPEPRDEVGKETIFPVAVAVTALLLLRFVFLIVAVGVTGITIASSTVATDAVDLPQFKFSVTALVVSAFDSIKFDVAAVTTADSNAIAAVAVNLE